MAVTIKNATGDVVPVESDLLEIGDETAQVQGLKLVYQTAPQTVDEDDAVVPGTGVDAPGTAEGGLLVEVSNLPADPPTETTLGTIVTRLEAIEAIVGGTVAVGGPLTDAELRGTPVAVTGTFWPVTQPVSGALTDTELRASAVPVSVATVPLPTGAATETTAAAILAKLIAAPATEASLAAVLAKIIAAPATEAKQDTANTALASILAKLIAAPATAAGQATEHTDLVALLTGIVLAAGENHLGAVGGNSVLVTVSPTLSVAGSYSTGDYIGQSTTPQSFTAARVNGGTALLKSLTIVDKQTAAAVAMELWFLSATFGAPTDNGTWTITDAEALTVLGVIPISAGRWYASGANKVYSDDTLGLVLKAAGGTTAIFYALVARGTTPTWSAGDLQLSLGILQD